MKFKGVGFSHPGKKRTNNEDHFLIDETHPDRFGLYIVCDGVGGHASGEVASQTAANEIRIFLANHAKTIEQFKLNPTSEVRTAIVVLIEQAIQVASAKVHSIGQADPSKNGMGTTLVMLLVTGHHAFLSHVGDSRIYLLRGKSQHQLTEDHSITAEQIKKGMMTREEAEKSSYAHVITRAVGFQPWAQVDTLCLEIQADDTFVLCTDGLTDYVHANEILDHASQTAPERLAQELVKFANDSGGRDNATVISVRIEGEGRSSDLGMKMDEKLEILKKIPLFQHLTYKELVKILNICKMVSYAPGEKIVQEGQVGNEFFILLSGGVKVTKSGKHLATLKGTDFFGEMQLLDKVPRSATVVCEQPSKVLTLSRSEFYSVLKRDQALAVKVFWEFCQVLNSRLRAVNELFVSNQTEVDRDTGELPFIPSIDLPN